MIEDTCLISREREGKNKWVPLGKTNGILETQAGDKKICDVCLYRYERPFLLLQGLRGIYGRFILFFLRVDPPQRGDLWQPCFRNCCFSQIREAPRRRFFCTCWISKVSSLKQSSHQYWGSEWGLIVAVPVTVSVLVPAFLLNFQSLIFQLLLRFIYHNVPPESQKHEEPSLLHPLTPPAPLSSSRPSQWWRRPFLGLRTVEPVASLHSHQCRCWNVSRSCPNLLLWFSDWSS